MIRINLLPVREAKRQANMRKQGALLGVAAGMGVLLSVAWNLTIVSAASAKQAEIRDAKKELKQLESTREEVERFREEKEDIENKLSVIQNLQRNRTGQVRILDEIADRIPERMWIESLDLSGGNVKIGGVSIDAEVVAEFLNALAASPELRDVDLEETTLVKTDGLKLNKFRVTARYGSAPPASSGKPGKKKRTKK